MKLSTKRHLPFLSFSKQLTSTAVKKSTPIQRSIFLQVVLVNFGEVGGMLGRVAMYLNGNAHLNSRHIRKLHMAEILMA